MTFIASAEYRVFQLQIQNVKDKTVKQVESTLDPEQYAGVYPLEPGERISYALTWRCPGRTDFFKPHCPKPAAKPQPPPGTDPNRSPAAVSGESPEVKK